jgi:predicted NUDIX family NTP pyrophosphohydrolase
MAKQSAGILLYRVTSSGLEVLLVHPGGPFWAKKDAGAWSIPKGEFQKGEDALAAAKREFSEETGLVVHGALVPLGPAKQPSGKVIHAWALEGDCDAKGISSNLFTMEWPPRSGQHAEFPEVDRAEWFTVDRAKQKLLKGQVVFLERLGDQLRAN